MLSLKVADDGKTIIFNLPAGGSAAAPMVTYKSDRECWPYIVDPIKASLAFSKLLSATSVVNSND